MKRQTKNRIPNDEGLDGSDDDFDGCQETAIFTWNVTCSVPVPVTSMRKRAVCLVVFVLILD